MSPAWAQEIAPDVLAKKVTDEVIGVLRADKDIQAGNTKKVLDLVESKILPHFNFARMTRLAVGAPWRQATPAQQAHHATLRKPPMVLDADPDVVLRTLESHMKLAQAVQPA